MSRSCRCVKRREEDARVDALLKEEEQRLCAPGTCIFCGRKLVHPAPEKVPNSVGRLRAFEGMPYCMQCFHQLSRMDKRKELKDGVLSIEGIMENEDFLKYLNWVKKVSPETVYT